MPDSARRLVGALVATAVGRHADARNGRQRSIEDSDDLSQADLRRRSSEQISASLAAAALHDAMPLEFQQNLLEELLGNSLSSGDVGHEDRSLFHLARQKQGGLEAVFRLACEHDLAYQNSRLLTNMGQRACHSKMELFEGPFPAWPWKVAVGGDFRPSDVEKQL